MTAFQFNHMKDSFLKKHVFGCQPDDNFVLMLNIVTILVLIPLLDQCVYPCLQERTPNMLKRIGLGYILLIFSAIVLCTYEGIGNADCMLVTSKSSSLIPLNSWLALLPTITATIAEVFVNVTGTLHIMQHMLTCTKLG